MPYHHILAHFEWSVKANDNQQQYTGVAQNTIGEDYLWIWVINLNSQELALSPGLKRCVDVS